MNEKVFLLCNLALGFYNVGTIWAHEVDIFRTWRLVDPKDFLRVQTVHWRKLPFWVFIPVGLGIAGSVVLVWYHPANSPPWGVGGAVACQILSIVLTAMFWGRWQAESFTGSPGPKEPSPHQDTKNSLGENRSHQPQRVRSSIVGDCRPVVVRYFPSGSRHRAPGHVPR